MALLRVDERLGRHANLCRRTGGHFAVGLRRPSGQRYETRVRCARRLIGGGGGAQRNAQAIGVLDEAQCDFGRAERHGGLAQLLADVVDGEPNERAGVETVATTKRDRAQELRVGATLETIKMVNNNYTKTNYSYYKVTEINRGLTSITSVRVYLIQPRPFWPATCTTTDGFGARPWPSHSRLSHEMADSQMGTSPMSKNTHRNMGRRRSQHMK